MKKILTELKTMKQSLESSLKMKAKYLDAFMECFYTFPIYMIDANGEMKQKKGFAIKQKDYPKINDIVAHEYYEDGKLLHNIRIFKNGENDFSYTGIREVVFNNLYIKHGFIETDFSTHFNLSTFERLEELVKKLQ